MRVIYGRARRGAALGTIVLATAGISGPAHAGAFYIADQSTKATGRAYSGETAEQGAQQQGYNPASIGGTTGIQQYFGFTALLPKAVARDNGTTVTEGGVPRPVGGNSGRNPINNGYLPNGGVAAGITDKIAVGFTMTSPFSFTTNYTPDFFGRYSADKSRLRTFDFQPSIAFAPSPHVSFGAAANVEYLRATLSNSLPNPLNTSFNYPAQPYGDAHQYLKGKSIDVGYSLGFQYHDDKVDIGASYKSAIKHHIKGKLIIDGFDGGTSGLGQAIAGLVNQHDSGARASFDTPWQVNLGVRYHLTPKFTVEGNVTRFGWERFDAISLYNLGATIGDQKVVENYKNSFSYSVGFDYDIAPKLTLRGGVVRDLSPIQDGYRDPRVPDGNRWGYAGGATIKVNDFVGVDLAALYAHIASNPINSTQVLYGTTLLQTTTQNNGTLSGAHALLFSIGAHLAI